MICHQCPLSFLVISSRFFLPLPLLLVAPLDLDSVRFMRFELRARQPIKNLIVGAAKSIFVKIGSRLSIAPRQPRARSYSTRNVIPGCNRRFRSDRRVNLHGGIIARGRKMERASVPFHIDPDVSFSHRVRRLFADGNPSPSRYKRTLYMYMCDACVAYSVYKRYRYSLRAVYLITPALMAFQ